MRLWSISPRYLDCKGLIACWREGLLAQKVLLGETKGYKNHPQLERFKKSCDPLGYIGYYLWEIWKESNNRNYNFNINKIKKPLIGTGDFTVTKGQLKYEFQHLNNKLKIRDYKKYRLNYTLISKFKGTEYIESHPLFKVIKGKIESWEKIK